MFRLKSIYVLFLLILLIFVYFLKYSFFSGSSRETRVVFFDVEQGDAALIQTPYKQDILIDAGPDKTIIDKIDKRLGFFDRDIELAVLTHNHSDHLKGFLELLNSGIKIDKLIYSNIVCEDNVCGEFYKVIQENEIETIQAKQGMEIDLFCAEDNSECYGLTILGPIDKFAQDKNLNNTSVILKAHFPERDFLFTGDAEDKVWKYYYSISAGRDVAMQRLYGANVLKVPHHGSKNGTSKELLELVKPQEAVISVGKDNKFGHPHVETIQLLESSGIKIRRTDEEGDIEY